MNPRALGLAAALLAAGCSSAGPASNGSSTSTSSSSGSSGSLGSSGSTGSSGSSGSTGGCGLTTFLDGFTPLRVLHVSPSGNDSADGLTPATAWATLAPLSTNLQPGDEVDVAAGTYPCSANISIRATASHPVWIRSSDGRGQAILDCAGADQGVYIGTSSYVALEGFELRNGAGHLLHIDSGSPWSTLTDHILIRGNHIHQAGLACIKVSQADHIDVLDNDLSDAEAFGSSPSGQIVDMVAVDDARIVGNRLSATPNNVAVQVKGGSTDALIEGNRIWDVGNAINLGGSTGPTFFVHTDADYEGLRVLAVNNLIYGATRVAFDSQGCHDCAALHNSVALQNAAQPVRLLPGASPSGAQSITENLRLEDNILYFSGSAPADLLNANPLPATGFVQDHNLFFFTGGAMSAVYSDIAPSGAGLIVDRDPLFADAANGDLTLQTGSPAIGAGVSLAEVTRDATGACRTDDDLGAF